jgi:D-lactate dehydrogenase
MKLFFFDVEPWEKNYIEENFKDLSPTLIHEPLSEDNIDQAKEAEIVSVFLPSKLTPDVIGKLPSLKHIATRSTGFDHVDIAAASEKNIIVSNVPFYGENTVAEMAFALILMVSRKLYPSYLRSKDLKFNHDELMGFDLKDKTLGIVGMGHIGEYSARYGNGFGMKVLASDPNKDEALAKKLNFEYADSLEDLLKKADVVTLHAPYNEHTHHLINRENIKLMKPGSIIVNTARGGLIETEALIWALDNGVLAGAGLDVLEGEPELKEEWQIITKDYNTDQLKDIVMNNILIERDDVIVTPHNAFNTKEAIGRILEVTQENIRSFIKGEPKNAVKPKK